MKFINILGVMADSVERAFDALSFEGALYIVAGFVGIVFLLLFVHILFGSKATTARRARHIAKYFNNRYIGTYLDGKIFLRKRRLSLNKKAREEFNIFLGGSIPLASTDFCDAVLSKGAISLHLIMPICNICIAISTIFLIMIADIKGLITTEFYLYVLIPFATMYTLKIALFGLIRIIDRSYNYGANKLIRSVNVVRYNNEYPSYEIDEDNEQNDNYTRAEEVISKMQSLESTLDGDSEVRVRDSMMESVANNDKSNYEDILSRLSDNNK